MASALLLLGLMAFFMGVGLYVCAAVAWAALSGRLDLIRYVGAAFLVASAAACASLPADDHAEWLGWLRSVEPHPRHQQWVDLVRRGDL